MAVITYGKMPTALPPGMFKAVRFPVLARMDHTTGDHRRLASTGASARDLATWSISAQFTKSIGHDGAVVSGALHEITFDTESGVVSGRGFVLDDEFGRRHAFAISTGAMTGNSIGTAEVSARYVEDLATDEYFIEFTKWSIADTTGVMTPAFIDARAEVDDEITAALGEDPMEELIASCTDFTIHVPEPTDAVAELLASAGGEVARYADFFRPEAEEPTKIIVTGDGKVYGHLSLWDRPHDGVGVPTPRPTDGYRSFNKPGVLTERGIVPTGPIFALGGHRKANGQPDLDAAYGGIENAWADVRIIEGNHGPWISGVLRPGVDENVVYAARASRISGHWVKGGLKAIVSVNAEAFEVPGPDADVIDLAASFAYRMEGDEMVELVASFPAQSEPKPIATVIPPTAYLTWTTTSNATQPITVSQYLPANIDLDALAQALLGRLREAGEIQAVRAAEAAADEPVDDPLFRMLIEDD